MSLGMSYSELGTELIDMLFNQSEGIHADDIAGLNRLESDDILAFPELSFTDGFDEDFLKSLADIDELNQPARTNEQASLENSVLVTANQRPHKSSHSSFHESDHQYCRPVENAVPNGPQDCFSGSPINFNYTSDSLFSLSNSPTSTTSEEVALNAEVDQSNLSPLGEAFELNSINSGQDVLAVLLQSSEIDHTFQGSENDVSGLVSVDMDTGDIDSMSDDDDISFNNLLEDSSRESLFGCGRTSVDGLPFTVHDIGQEKNKTNKWQELALSEEEKALLAREGIELPNGLPLTKKKKVPTATLR